MAEIVKWDGEFATSMRLDGDLRAKMRVELSEYFSNVKVHYMIGRSEDIRNCAYFYCGSFERVCPSIKIQSVKRFTATTTTRSVFFDWDNNAYTVNTAGDTGTPATSIVVNDRRVGWYFAETNTLFCSDWVHDEEAMTVFSQIKEELFNVVLTKKFRKTREKKAKVKREKFNITVGSDPEFELIRNGEIVNAMSVIRNRDGEIGLDGAGAQVELRPKPAKKHKEATEAVRVLVRKFADRYADCELGVKGDRYPLGGHIHFGAEGKQLPVSINFIRVLDNWIGKMFVPLSGKARGGYLKYGVDDRGRLTGAVETKPWGFEYRSLPACIFCSPLITANIYRVCLKLANLYYNGKGVKVSPDSKADWEALGIKYAYTEFAKFNKKKLSQGGIYKFWRIKKATPVEMISFEFRDEWNSEIKTHLADQIRIALRRAGVHNVRITLLGLKAERGDVVAGFRSVRYRLAEDYAVSRYSPTTTNVFTAGLPHSFRVSATATQVEVVASEIATTIVTARR